MYNFLWDLPVKEFGKSVCICMSYDQNSNYFLKDTHTTILRLSGFFPGQPGWAGTRRNIHPLTSYMIINHPLSVFLHLLWSMASYLFNLHAKVFFHNLCKSSLVYLLAWQPPLNQQKLPYIYIKEAQRLKEIFNNLGLQ